jgi:hypothetical protein
MRAVAIGAAISGVFVHLAMTLSLALMIVTAGYSFASAHPDGGSVGSLDELSKLGASPWIALYTLVIVAVIDFILTPLLFVGRRAQYWAWTVPVLAIAVSIGITVIAIAAFEVPPPDLGG